eukprot:m.2005 g.2005  ORF g.2005 m.2005 type:complete len:158 (+) comp8167_c0_seq1:763-1236(+)
MRYPKNRQKLSKSHSVMLDDDILVAVNGGEDVEQRVYEAKVVMLFSHRGFDGNQYCWIKLCWYERFGDAIDKETGLPVYTLERESSEVYSPDPVRGKVHMSHLCQWIAVPGTGVGETARRNLEASALPAPCEFKGDKVDHNIGNLRYLKNLYFENNY